MVKHPVFDRPVLRHQNRKRAAGIEPDEFDLAQPPVVLGRHDDARAAREAGEQAGRLPQQSLEAGVGALAGDLALDADAFLGRQFADLQQRIDEEAQAGLGRQAPRAGVRRIDEAEFFQILHHVSDRGRGERHRQDARQMPRTDWLARVEVGFDDRSEDFARAGIERAQRSRRSRFAAHAGHARKMAVRAISCKSATPAATPHAVDAIDARAPAY